METFQKRKFLHIRTSLKCVDSALYSDSKTGVAVRTGDTVTVTDKKGKTQKMKVITIASKTILIAPVGFPLSSGIFEFLGKFFKR